MQSKKLLEENNQDNFLWLLCMLQRQKHRNLPGWGVAVMSDLLGAASNPDGINRPGVKKCILGKL